MKEKMKIVNFRFEPELIAKLKVLAKKKRETVSFFVRKTLWKEVEKWEDGENG